MLDFHTHTRRSIVFRTRTLVTHLTPALLFLSGCAARTDLIKALANDPNSFRYVVLQKRAREGRGITVTYPVDVAHARRLTLFILGAHDAVGIAERDGAIFATVPDLRWNQLDGEGINAIGVWLTPGDSGTTRVTALSISHSVFLKRQTFPDSQFHEEFARALARHAAPQNPASSTAPRAEQREQHHGTPQ